MVVAMAKLMPTDATSTSRREADLHDAEAKYLEDYLRRTKWHGLTAATTMRLQRRNNAHRTAAAKLRG